MVRTVLTNRGKKNKLNRNQSSHQIVFPAGRIYHKGCYFASAQWPLELWLVSAGPNTCKQAIDICADPLISILVFSSDVFCHSMDSEDADSTTNNKSNAVTTSNRSTHRFLPLFLYVQWLSCHVTSSKSSSFYHRIAAYGVIIPKGESPWNSILSLLTGMV